MRLVEKILKNLRYYIAFVQKQDYDSPNLAKFHYFPEQPIKGEGMKSMFVKTVLALLVAILAFGISTTMAQKRGGKLTFVTAGRLPSFDGHQESTFSMVHPTAPFYSLLIRVNPNNPSSPTDFVCDLCVGKVPTPENNGTKYTFKIQEGVKFHDGTPLTSADIKATYDRIIFPPKGVKSLRKAFFKMVASVVAPDATTVIFNLKHASGAFIPALATPFNFIYSKKDLDTQGHKWHEKNVNGSGPFKFVEYVAGSHVEGVRYDSYHHQGQPYLDGFRSVIAPKMAVRVNSIRGDRASIEFRGFPPKSRDDLKKALGDDITVQESTWNCSLLVVPNHKIKPFDDARVRRALTLAIDRWSGSKYLSEIAIVKTVGGVAFPGHPLASTKEELHQIAGYWEDIEASRAEARKLLKAAGQAGLSFELLNRATDQPYKVVGTWVISQWAKIGLKVKQKVVPTGPWRGALRDTKDFQVAIDANCQSVINPILDVTKFLGSAGNNYAQYEDPELEVIWEKMFKAVDELEQRKYMLQYEKHALDTQAHQFITLWWHKINPYRSYVKGWKVSPSHYLNQQLDNIWLDK